MDKNLPCIKVDVKVDVKVAIARETAEMCLKIVEMYVNDGNARVIAEREPNGDVRYHFD